MGGTALGEQLPRISKAKYLDLVEELRNRLQPRFFGYVEAQRSLPDKDSFGDVDLIVADCRETLNPQQHLSSSKASTNGDIMSFEYGGHQVDLIRVGTIDGVELTRFCCDYGDVGMIVGMMVRGISMKFGDKGLVMMVENRKIKLSRSLPEILRFLGLDIEMWRAGFASEEEIFAFVTTSKYFHTQSFRRDTSRASEDGEVIWRRDARKREGKRPMFSRFIDSAGSLPARDHLDVQKVRHQALQVFHKQKEALAIEADSLRAKRIKDKFNGSLVTE